MSRIIQRLYHSIKLHLGIKRFLEFYFKEIQFYFDNHVVLLVSRMLDSYLFHRIIKHYGADYRWGDTKSQNLDMTTHNSGYGNMHYAMVRNVRPRQILCVGSMFGFIPYMLARGCMDNRLGHVDFVDAAFDFNDKTYKNTHYFGQGFWKKVNTNRHFTYLLDNKYISTHVMTVEEFCRSQKHRTFDYVYLDGDHSYDGLIRDIRLIWPRLQRGGFLCLHDIEFDFNKSLKNEKLNKSFINTVKHVSFGVKRIWKEMSVIEYKLPILNGYSGIGYFRKPTDDKAPLPDFLT